MGIRTQQRKVVQRAGGSVIDKGEYRGFRLDDVVFRVGALDILRAPSRYGNTLSYPQLYVKESKNG